MTLTFSILSLIFFSDAFEVFGGAGDLIDFGIEVDVKVPFKNFW